MTKLILKLTFFFLFFVGGSLSTSAYSAVEKKSDVRLLIDISGSMKKNDPNNLRIPALQLVTNLLPKGGDAGVWAFGKQVNMMVKLSSVDQSWQENATKTANKINSRGLFTNIGSVLEKASYGWSRPDPNEKRSFVLLTDGMVDISKDPAVNAEERARILNTVLPKLKKAGVAIHTVALSQNADHELLKELSTQTDGRYEAVNNAEELQRVFLKIFEQAAERDSLPIKDNLFSVDSSIDEMTVLIFKKDEKEASLISPKGSVLNQNSNDTGLRWFSTKGYDLVTLQKPESGDWKINANVDPDNRVMIVSKLGMRIESLPNNLLAGESISYQMQLLEDGSPILNDDFLSLVNATLVQTKGDQDSTLAMFFDSGQRVYKQSFFTDSFEGELQLQLNVSSPTFERVRNHTINIYGSPITAKIDVSEDNIVPHQLRIMVRDDIVDSSSLTINATIKDPEGEKKFLVIEDWNNPIEIPASLAGGDYSISFKVAGNSVLKRPFSVSPEALLFSSKRLIQEEEAKPEAKVVDKLPAEVIDDVREEETKPVVEKTIEENTEVPGDSVEPPEEEQVSSINWIYVGIGGNLLLGIAGFFVWRILKKRNTKKALSMTDELGIDGEDEDEDEDEDEIKKKD